MEKHSGLITSDEAEKLYSYPTIPAAGDSDCTTYLCGNGEFDHPHVEYGVKSGGATLNYTFDWGKGSNVLPQITTDKYGHITSLKFYRLSQNGTLVTPEARGLMSAADKALLDSIASYLADQQGS